MSRQREYQQRMRFAGKCIICGKDAANSLRKTNGNGKSPYCPEHVIIVRERNRAKASSKRRNLHARSYKEITTDDTENTDTHSGGRNTESP